MGYPITFTVNPRRGRLADVHPVPKHAPSVVRRARECSLKVRGTKLFNIIPKSLRDTVGTVDQFKFELEKWLATVPDQPTVSDRQRAAKTNSLLDQVPLIPEQF